MTSLTTQAGTPFEIVQVVREFGTAGGVERVAWELAAAFGRAGVANGVVASVVEEDLGASTKIAQVGSWLSRIPARGTFRYLGRLLAVPLFTLEATHAVNRLKGERVISHGDCLAGDVLIVHAVNAESLQQKRLLGDWAWLLNPIHYWVALRDLWMIRGLRYRLYVAVSTRVREELQQGYRVPAERIRVIPNGIDATRFGFSSAAREKIRAELGVPADARLLLFVGHEFKRKGLAFVIEALALLGSGYWLAVVGADDAARYKKLAAEAQERVVFCGERKDVAAFYSAADAFILPTAYETFSLVCMEAMAAGLPVFATKVGGIEDYLVDGVNGYAIERDARDITAKIADAFGADSELAALRAGARTTAMGFGWDGVAAKYIETLRELDQPKLRSRA